MGSLSQVCSIQCYKRKALLGLNIGAQKRARFLILEKNLKTENPNLVIIFSLIETDLLNIFSGPKY
jgi:hypothetical protein